jgi:RNA polymerase sigma factor (sigma-70 family)
VSSGQGKGKKRPAYRPSVEVLEALRLLSNAAQALPSFPVAHDVLPPGPTAVIPDAPTPSSATWDAALGQTSLADILGSSRDTADSGSVAAGLNQLNKYLNRAWYRAGVPVQLHDDSTQAVYVSLLQNLGRSRFDALLSDIGQNGIPNVLSRETDEGPDFFRAIDTVKKRAQREKSYQPLDTIDVSSSNSPDDDQTQLRGDLQEAIAQSLSPREASLIHDTLMGKTPAEIASQWGVAPKTVSNEKTRVIQKLREALVADPGD